MKTGISIQILFNVCLGIVATAFISCKTPDASQVKSEDDYFRSEQDVKLFWKPYHEGNRVNGLGVRGVLCWGHCKELKDGKLVNIPLLRVKSMPIPEVYKACSWTKNVDSKEFENVPYIVDEAYLDDKIGYRFDQRNYPASIYEDAFLQFTLKWRDPSAHRTEVCTSPDQSSDAQAYFDPTDSFYTWRICPSADKKELGQAKVFSHEDLVLENARDR